MPTATACTRSSKAIPEGSVAHDHAPAGRRPISDDREKPLQLLRGEIEAVAGLIAVI